jgi:hypothetical protein
MDKKIKITKTLTASLIGCCLSMHGTAFAQISSQVFVINKHGYVMPVLSGTGQADLCPNTPFGEAEDVLGCSISQRDADFDGVSDADDICTTTPMATVVNGFGCSQTELDALNAQDADADSVPDYLDQCAGTVAGGVVNQQGCTPDQIDSDNDGIADYLDAYPWQNDSICTP